MNYMEDIDGAEDTERVEIKNELSSLSFEELQKLKEKIGAKVYNEAVFGKKVNNPPSKHFKRENKNRPMEISSKKPVSMLRDVEGIKKKKKEIRDPRFDPLCGTFDKKEFNENFNFLGDLRKKDIKTIKNELRETDDPEKRQSLRSLLQRLQDKQRADVNNKKAHDKMSRERSQVKQDFSEGKRPIFKNKSEMRVEALVNQYEELKKEGTGRIQRHLKRRQQKIKKKSHRAPTGADME